MTPKASLEHLAPTEQRALVEFVQLLRERFNGLVRCALLFGSKARSEKTFDSDLDVLVVDSDDWRLHKQIRYLAADICLKYGLNLSPRVWSVSHHREVEELQTLLYQNIHRDGINLLEIAAVAANARSASPHPLVSPAHLLPESLGLRLRPFLTRHLAESPLNETSGATSLTLWQWRHLTKSFPSSSRSLFSP